EWGAEGGGGAGPERGLAEGGAIEGPRQERARTGVTRALAQENVVSASVREMTDRRRLSASSSSHGSSRPGDTTSSQSFVSAAIGASSGSDGSCPVAMQTRRISFPRAVSQ